MQIDKKIDPIVFCLLCIRHTAASLYFRLFQWVQKRRKKLVHPYIFNLTHKNGVMGKKSRIICHVSCTSHYTQPRRRTVLCGIWLTFLINVFLAFDTVNSVLTYLCPILIYFTFIKHFCLIPVLAQDLILCYNQ